MTEVADIIDKIIQSYESELREYLFWDIYLEQLKEELHQLNERMYSISAIRYDQSSEKKHVIDRDQMLAAFITKKNALEREIQIIENKIYYVDELLESLDEDDRIFIEQALINRLPRETNDMIAVRLGITEGGLRYKIKKILKAYIKEEFKKEE